MQEHKYRARDKTVRKISRGGLVEENLRSHEKVRITKKEEDFELSGREDDPVDLKSVHTHRKEEEPERKKKQKKYMQDMLEPDPEEETESISGERMDGFDEKQKPAERYFRNYVDSERKSENNTEDDSVDTENGQPEGITEHSLRMGQLRTHPAGSRSDAETSEEKSHQRKKKQIEDFARKEKDRKKTAEEGEPGTQKERNQPRDRKKAEEPSMDSFREEIRDKARREQVHKEQRKKKTRLDFGDEKSGMIRGNGAGIGKRTVSAATGSAEYYLHEKLDEAEQENAAVEGSHKAEQMAENALRYAMHRANRGLRKRNLRLQGNEPENRQTGRLQFSVLQEKGINTGKHATETGQKKKQEIRRFWQKQRYKKAYQAARKGEERAEETIRVTQTVFSKVKRVAVAIINRSRGILGAAMAVVLLFSLMATSLSSCSAFLQGGTTTVVGTTYPSTDEDIYAVENAYKALEDALNAQINSMESRHPGYEEYRYQIDEISHNPYHLISYFTVKYGEFTYEQVKEEIEEIFRQQYGISTDENRETVTETRKVRVGESLGQVVTSGYCNCSICCGVWAGGPTASGAMPQANHTIAVDAAHPFLPMGTKVVMNGVEYVVEDSGNFAQYGVQFDVYYGDHATASAHGHQTWEAYIADSNGSREVEVTSTRDVNRMDVTLTNHNLDAVLRSRLDENEEKRYDIYNTTLGNRDYLFDNVPSYGGGGFGYEIPAEALSDRKFANMIREAEKYLGYPYVWGGASPETSFDCSGFVSWVINNCGNGWNVGRQTADGLRSFCAYVPPSQAKPGDLIFFQNTYSTPGASHVGIYVGNNMMIHCGKPVQYTSIATSYWQEHFMAFGRLS